jgi:hypothetical protein
MPRLTWLASELRDAGLRVVEVDGWQTRGSTDFSPVGVTWHATAGSRKATAEGEVGVILNGSATAPPPIAQIMLWRDGTLYVCASGRCNHNKVGWDGPNKGLGNTKLIGIEMSNDNKGEPWPEVQLDAARRATAVIMRKLGADPMRRLAAHYEHQPYATRPPGETSTKSDPYGVDMTKERPRVAALMTGDDSMTTKAEFIEWLEDKAVRAALCRAIVATDNVIPSPSNAAPNADGTPNTHWGLAGYLKSIQENAVSARIHAADAKAGIANLKTASAAEIVAALPPELARQVADELAARLAS